MKSVKNLALALLLVFAVTVNVAAGDVPIPPEKMISEPTVTSSGEITPMSFDPNSEQPGETVESSDYLLFEALAALLYLY